MVQIEDIVLLRQYVADESEEAFSTLVSRHIDLVYGAALRQVRDPHLAEEIAQTVFVLLSKKARTLPRTAILTGWLYRATGYVASDALRSENRRRHRETAALNLPSEAKTMMQWEEIEPILDPAMAALGEKDRTLILLRFFEDKSLKEIGSILGVSEDAAQKKVMRAMEKLREILLRRGATVSSISLAGILEVFECGSAPPALAAAIGTINSASSAAVSITFVTRTALHFMTVTKLKLAGAVLAILAVVSTPIVTQQRALSQERAENATLRAAIQKLELGLVTGAPNVDTPEVDRLRKDAAEVVRLRGQVAALLRERAQTATTPVAGQPDDDAVTKDPMKRQTAGDTLVKEGKFAEALENYLWCYDEGTKHSPSYVGVRNSFLLMQIAALGAKYPPAKDALISRRDGVEAALLANKAGDPVAPFTLVQLNQNLGDPGRTLSLFDQLPANSPARGQLVTYGMEQFSSASRYQDIVDSGRPEAAFDQASRMAKLLPTDEKSENDVWRNDAMRQNAVAAGGRALEALAAVGQTDRANALVDKILQFDKTPETKAELLKHAERGGNASVTAHLQSQ